MHDVSETRNRETRAARPDLGMGAGVAVVGREHSAARPPKKLPRQPKTIEDQQKRLPKGRRGSQECPRDRQDISTSSSSNQPTPKAPKANSTFRGCSCILWRGWTFQCRTTWGCVPFTPRRETEANVERKRDGATARSKESRETEAGTKGKRIGEDNTPNNHFHTPTGRRII